MTLQLVNPPPLVVKFNQVTYIVHSVFQPIYDLEGRLLAVELLSRFYQQNNIQQILQPAHFFRHAHTATKRRVTAHQLAILHGCLPWLAEHHIVASINIDRMQAQDILSNPPAYRLLKILAPWVRLEINECFLLLGGKVSDDPLLMALSQCSPLWLDDFGSGGANFSMLFSGLFEVVKLDHDIFDVFMAGESGRIFMPALLNLIQEHCFGLIIEGVATTEVQRQVQHWPVLGLQGFLWPTLSLDELDKLRQPHPKLL